jgi:purine-binding chemotaxis protein CheW
MKQSQQAVAIDWQKARERLASAIAATDAALRLSPQRAREVMDARAAALARAPDEAAGAAETREVLSFQIATERYAIDTRIVREVQRQPEATPVPGTPGFVLGVANLRGEMLALFDLGEFLSIGLPRRELSPWLIVLGEERAEFGIVCDAVLEVHSLRGDALHPAPGSLAAAAREVVTGVTSDALIVLDGEKLLADPRLFIDDSTS